MRKQMTNSVKAFTKEVSVVKKIVALAALAVCVVALAAAPALAEGYNQSGYSFTGGASGTDPVAETNYPDASGLYVRYPSAGQVSNGATSSLQGPHGGYNTTTNKCQDCHSTHYASGAYMLLRANDRENACSFCHAGGGGSKLNIQMDNAYDETGMVLAQGAAADTTRGAGTGHTLGYKGKAPADIEPAYQDTSGFACFDCHSPHGNSARILTTFSDPGRAVYDAVAAGVVGAVAGDKYLYVTDIKYFAGNGTFNTVDFNEAAYGLPALTDPTTSRTVYDLNAVLSADIATMTPAGYGGIFGVTPEGNTVFKRKDGDPTQAGAQTDAKAIWRPVWQTGSFLLLKNPDNETGANGMKTGKSGDMTVTAGSEVASQGVNKFPINWDDPLGPADQVYGGNQNNNRNDAEWNSVTKQWEYDGDGIGTTVAYPSAPTGILSAMEFCTDCHDGAAGASTQAAKVYFDENQDDVAAGDYATAYSHDAQPRH